MADIVAFVPQSHLDAQANMAGFIELCRTRLTSFGASLVFDADRWEVSEHIQRKGRHHALGLVFSKQATSRKRQSVMMDEPFRSFAKSYIRYQHGMRPTISLTNRMTALRALEAALLETGTADAVRTNGHVLNRAAQLLAERLASSSAYVAANQLQMIAEFMCDNCLMTVPMRWVNPLQPPDDHRTRIGKSADERRAAKMPSQAALDALPKVFRMATDPIDVMVSSITAFLCAAPDRISEILCLPSDCEIKQKSDRSGEDVYGLRWWPVKGAAPMVKWIIPSMASVVKAAVGKIRKLTDEAREIARWYEQNPTRLYLAPGTEHLRVKEWLSLDEMATIVFAEPVSLELPVRWCTKNEVLREHRGRRAYARFADVEAAVLRQLPPGFPVADRTTGLKYGDALFVTQRNALHPSRPRFRCVIEPVRYNQIRHRLGASSVPSRYSIFERCGFAEPGGEPIRINTHQFRHYLNTLAQAGGLSQLDIAKWSGRKDVRQNRHYDHETSDAVVARIRAAVGDDTRFFGPLATRPRADLITRDEFARLKVPTAHATDFGYCVHDYVMSPCEMHRDCLKCGEQVCVKGEPEKEKRIRQAHVEATLLLSMAEQAEAEGEFGASDWAEHHKAHLARVTALLHVLDDPAVPRGAVIQLMSVDTPSRLEHAAQARALLLSSVESSTLEGKAT
ncbi:MULTISPECIES: integrase [Burkholderia cepacia complex]|uniref:integrase n=1 Tax=Burkholderia cepacia complex TaxID=87882 RepID=UPI002011BDF9|nr:MULTISPECIES: integrase [Burkholderia cepacia complex]MDN8051295.1 integrase [Burkholderia multivorans]